jgi:hypothetical protein
LQSQKNIMNKVLTLIVCLSISQFTIASPVSNNLKPAATADKMHAKAPVMFVENAGQITDQYHNVRPDVQFCVGAMTGLNIFVGNGVIHYQFSKADMAFKQPTMQEIIQPGFKPQPINYDMYRMDVELVGANQHPQIIKEQKQDYFQQFLSSNGDENSAIAHAYNRIVYKDIYPNIDWVLYTFNGHLKHEFVVRPGGRVGDIQLKYGGAKELKLNANGSIEATTPQGVITEEAPVTYEGDGKKILSSFKLNGDVLSYQTGSYSGELTIDPTLIWATYYGGISDDNVNGMAVDASGNVYIAGVTASGSGIATTGAFQTFFGGWEDGFLAKFDASGALKWGTYYGSSAWEGLTTVTVDASGNVYAAGYTESAGYGTGGTFQPTFYGGALVNGILFKFNSAGTRLWCTYFGNYNEYFQSITTDPSGNVFGAIYCQSSGGMATPGAYQSSSGGGWEAMVAGFTSSGTRLWSTYFGGSGDDFGQAIITDASGNVYCSGATASSASIASAGAFQTLYGGGQDAFLAKFNNTGTFQWATYYGGSGSESASGLVTDASGYVYMAGGTASSSGIASVGAYQTSLPGSNNGYLTKFNNLGTRQWGTYYGGSGNDAIDLITPDPAGNIYVTGSATSTTGIATPGAFQTANAGGTDAFFAKFSNSGSFLYGSYYGGSGTDNGLGILLDGLGYLYLAGSTQSTSGIATAGAYQTANAGGYDAFIAKFSVCTRPVVAAVSGPVSVCAGSTVTLSDATTGGVWSSSNTSIATVGSTRVVTGVSAGLDTISYSVTNACGTSNATYAITVNPPPVSGTISGAAIVCIGSAVALTDAASGGVWSSSNTGIATAGSAGIVAGISGGTATISYTVTNVCGVSYASHIITVKSFPDPGVITGTTTTCPDSSAQLSDAVAGGAWSSANTGIVTVSSTGALTGVAAGGATISYAVTNICGTTYATQSVTVNPGPDAGTIFGPATVCPDSAITLADPATGGAWSSIVTGVATIDPTGLVRGITPGTTLIGYSVANSCGTAQATFTVTVLSADACTVTGVKTITGNTAGLNVYPNPSTGAFTIELSSPVDEEVTITVTNLLGEKLLTQTGRTNKNAGMNLNATAGIYFVRVSAAHYEGTVRVVVE